MSPLVTPKANLRRYKNTMKFLDRKSVFNIDDEIFQQAVEHVKYLLVNGNKIEPVQEVAIDGSDNFFQKTRSNVGWPFYRNEKGEINGKTYKEYTLELSVKWIKEYGPS